MKREPSRVAFFSPNKDHLPIFVLTVFLSQHLATITGLCLDSFGWDAIPL